MTMSQIKTKFGVSVSSGNKYYKISNLVGSNKTQIAPINTKHIT